MGSELTACETPIDTGRLVFLVVTDDGSLVLLCHRCMSRVVAEALPATPAPRMVHPVWVQATIADRDIVCGQVVSRTNPRLN